MLSHASISDRLKIELPEELTKAWLHVIMALAFCIKDKHFTAFEEQNEICSRLLDDGMLKVVYNLNHQSLSERLVLMPYELTTFINSILLGDLTASSTPQPPAIHEVYLEYLRILVSSVDNYPK